MDKIIENEESLHTRFKWCIDYQGQMTWGVPEWCVRILERFENLTDSYRKQLIKECEVVGLKDLAFELKNYHENQKSYFVESLSDLKLITNGTPEQFESLQKSINKK